MTQFYKPSGRFSSLDSKGKVEFKSDEFVEYILIDGQLSKILLEK